jgi:cytochrome c553
MGRLRWLSYLGGVAIVTGVALASPPARAGDPQVLAASCSGCHTSTDGLTTAIPRIRGLPGVVFMQAMEGFRTGKRSATVMDRIAKGFTEDEIRQLAEYFNARK